MILLFVDRPFVDTNQVSHTSIYLLLPGSAGWNWSLKPCVFDMHPQHVGNLALEFVLQQKNNKKKRKAIFFKCTGEMHNVLIGCCLPARATVSWKSCAVLSKKKKFPEWIISSVAWKITQSVDSLQRQRAFWMQCPISQLFSVNYQPTTCQTLTVKMSATKISPSRKKGAAKCSWDDGGGAASPVSLKRQRSSTIRSVASQDTLTHLKR